WSKRSARSLIEARPRARSELAQLFRFRWRSPGPPCAIGRLERSDLVRVALGQRDVIPTVEQAGAADRIDGKAEDFIAALDRLLLEIHSQAPGRLLAEEANERGRLIVGDDRGQQAILRRVASKDVAEGWRDDAANAVIVEGIDRGLARGAAAEVANSHDDARLAPSRAIERKIRPLASRSIEAQIVKQRRSKSGRARQFQKARRQE